MSLPLYDCAIRTTKVASGEALIQLVPQASALGTGRMVRLREVWISNTTATGFGVGLGIATVAAGTPAAGGTIMRRSNNVGPVDALPTAAVWGGFTTTPTAPTGYHKRLWVPGNALVIATFNEGEELMVPPAATPLPFCVFNTGTGQIADITLTWAE